MPQAEAQQPKEVTSKDVADFFRESIRSEKAAFIPFANELGEKYKGLGRKPSDQELTQDFVAKFPEFLHTHRVTDLPALGAIASPHPPPAGPKPPAGPPSTIGTSFNRGVAEGVQALDRFTANALGAVGLKKASEYYRSRQHDAEKAVEKRPPSSGFVQNVAEAIPRAVIGSAPALATQSPLGLAGVTAVEHLDEGLLPAAENAAGAYAFGKAMPMIGSAGAKFGSKLAGESKLVQKVAAPVAVGGVQAAYDIWNGATPSAAMANAATMGGVSLLHGRARAKKSASVDPERKAELQKAKAERSEALKSKPENPKNRPTRTGEERFNQELAKEAVNVRQGGVERRIGEIQDSLNEIESMPNERWTYDDYYKVKSLKAEIQRLLATLPESVRDARLAEQNASKSQPIPSTPKPPAGPPAGPSEHPAVTSSAQKARLDAAQKRSVAPRTPVPGLGYRIAAEEVGEIPSQSKPVFKSVKGEEQPPLQPRKPSVKVPEGPDFERSINPEGKAYVANKMPGIPAGAKVIPRGLTPQGFVVDVLDSSGRMNQKVLPFHDSLTNMVEKGWLKPTAAPAETFREPLPGEPPSGPTKASKADDPAARTKTSPESRALPAPGPVEPIPGVTPFQPMQPGAPPSGPKGLLQEPPLRLEPQPQMSYEDQVALAKTQPPEVVQNFVEKNRSAFTEKTKGLPKAAIEQFTSKLNEYLRPFEEIAKPSAKAAPGKAAPSSRRPEETSQNPPAAPASSNIGQAPEPVHVEVANIIQTAIRRPGGEDWERITITPVGPDLRTPLGQPVTIPADQFTPDTVWSLVQGAKAQGIEIFNPDNKMRSGVVRKPIRDTPMAPPGRF